MAELRFVSVRCRGGYPSAKVYPAVLDVELDRHARFVAGGIAAASATADRLNQHPENSDLLVWHGSDECIVVEGGDRG